MDSSPVTPIDFSSKGLMACDQWYICVFRDDIYKRSRVIALQTNRQTPVLIYDVKSELSWKLKKIKVTKFWRRCKLFRQKCHRKLVII